MPQDRILVLGATGYLGRHIMARLQAPGTAVVRGAARRTVGLPVDMRAGTLMACDVTDDAALEQALADCDIVVNATAGPAGAMRAIVRNLCRSPLLAARGRRVIHISSLAVFGQPHGQFDEYATPVPYRGDRYASGKVEQEAMLLREAGLAGRVVVLRPGCIFGPGAPRWVGQLGRMLDKRRLGWLGHEGNGACHLLHVDDLAEQVAQACTGAAPAGIHHLLRSEAITWNRYFALLSSALGLPAPVSMSRAALRAQVLAAPWRAAAAKLGGWNADALSPSLRRLFASRAVVDVASPWASSLSYRALLPAIAALAPAPAPARVAAHERPSLYVAS